MPLKMVTRSRKLAGRLAGPQVSGARRIFSGPQGGDPRGDEALLRQSLQHQLDHPRDHGPDSSFRRSGSSAKSGYNRAKWSCTFRAAPRRADAAVKRGSPSRKSTWKKSGQSSRGRGLASRWIRSRIGPCVRELLSGHPG